MRIGKHASNLGLTILELTIFLLELLQLEQYAKHLLVITIGAVAPTFFRRFDLFHVFGKMVSNFIEALSR